MKKGLILEGGAMRGLFSAGIIDVLQEEGIEFDGAIGVSAGATFGCNFKSKQAGRVIRYNKRFAQNWRYASWRSFFLTGNYFGGTFAYHTLPTKLDPFDFQTFQENPMEFWIVCTDVRTGKPLYRTLHTCDYTEREYIRASASMPLVSKVVKVGNDEMLDGGISDSIPLRFFQERGYDRNLVVLTQPENYQKEINKLIPLIKLQLRSYPNFIKALKERHIMYNAQTAYVREEERKGNVFVLCPEEKLEIGHISHDSTQMEKTYEIGRATAQKNIAAIKKYFSLE